MDKYEKRRLRLIKLRDEMCGGKAAELARRISREPSYVSRMLYPEGKAGKKRIADDMMEVIEASFGLPRGWLDEIQQQLDAADAAVNSPLDAEKLTPEENELLGLFRTLPDHEAKRILAEVRARSAHFMAMYEEMHKKLHGKAS